MLIQEIITIDGRELQKTYSDAYKIRQIETGILYSVAVDATPCAYTYEVTDEPLPGARGRERGDAQSGF